jgi:predicted amidohydrolase YtcJ
MQDLGDALVSPATPAVIYSAQEIVTLDPARPSVAAVAVAGDRILAMGSLDQVRAALGSRTFRLDATFADQVIVPGLIAQHDHPLLAGLTMTSEIIAIDDWVLPRGTARAARNRTDYLQRLKAANDRMQDPAALLFAWG